MPEWYYLDLYQARKDPESGPTLLIADGPETATDEKILHTTRTEVVIQIGGKELDTDANRLYYKHKIAHYHFELTQSSIDDFEKMINGLLATIIIHLRNKQTVMIYSTHDLGVGVALAVGACHLMFIYYTRLRKQNAETANQHKAGKFIKSVVDMYEFRTAVSDKISEMVESYETMTCRQNGQKLAATLELVEPEQTLVEPQ